MRALDGVSFDLRPGEIHALVGENGAGKSTLIKTLIGEHPYGSFSGQILFRGQPARFRSLHDSRAAGIAAVHQELSVVKHLTVAENIFLGDEPVRLGRVDWDAIFRHAEAVIRTLGVDIDVRTEVVNLGIGEQQLVEITRALRRSTPVLILDEPTAALAEHEVVKLLGILRELRSRGIAVVHISHKLDEVFALADRITVLRDGRSVACADTAQWTRDKVVEAMVGRPVSEIDMPVAAGRPGGAALQVSGVTVADPDVPGRRLLDDVSFEVRAGEIVGIAGLMGAGRTELLRTLFGVAPGPWQGRIRVGDFELRQHSPRQAIAAGLALVPEDRKQQGLVVMFSVLENISMAHLREFCTAGVVDNLREFNDGRRQAETLDVKTPSVHAAVRTLSGGNQQKVVLGKWLLKQPKVLLLDEPTRGIDVGAKSEIHRLIRRLTDTGMAVLMVSSELPEVLGLSDRVLVLREGRLSAEFARADATPEAVMRAAT